MKTFKATVSVLCVCMLFAGCASSTAAPRLPDEYEGDAELVRVMHSYPRLLRKAGDLADESDLIVCAELISDLGVFDTSRIYFEKGFSDVDSGFVSTHYLMRVTETVKGDAKAGDEITVRLFGGLYEGVLHMNDFAERLTSSYTYLLFLDKPPSPDMPWELASDYQGYLPMRGERLSLNSKIAGYALFSENQSRKSMVSTIRRQMSSPEQLREQMVLSELERAQNSLKWSVENGLSIDLQGFTGKPVRHRGDSHVNGELYRFFYYDLNLTKKLDSQPPGQVYVVRVFDRDGVIYHEIVISDAAVLCCGEWYSYTNGFAMTIGEIYESSK